MHLMDAVYYVNYAYTHPYVLASIAATLCIGILTAAWCMTSMFSFSDIIPLVLMASLVFYMYD